MADIVFINPDPRPGYTASELDFVPPISILSLASFLKKRGYLVKIIDSRLYNEKEKKEIISDSVKDALFVGISCMTNQIKDGLELSKYIKKNFDDSKIVWGGVHPTLFPKETLSNPFIDVVVIGEGELTVLELTRALENRESSDVILGLGYKENGVIKINKRREPLDIDIIPSLDYGLIDAEKYMKSDYPFFGIKRELLVQASRGCPYRCAFCINYVEGAYNKWRPRSPEKVIKDVKALVKKYKINAISFRDEDFFVDKDNALEIIRGIKELGINWFANARANYFRENLISEKMVKEMKDSGLLMLGVGAESGSERMLEYITKDITIDNVYNFARLMAKYDIIASFSFIIGIPGETEKEMFLTVEMMKRLKKICPKSAFSGPQVLRPYPGGKLYDVCIENGFRAPTALEDWARVDFGKFGEISLENYSWIKNKELIQALSTYVPAALNYDFMKNLDLKRKIYAFISKLRLKFNFWRFPYEYKWTFRWLSFLNKIKKLLRK